LDFAETWPYFLKNDLLIDEIVKNNTYIAKE